MTDLYEILLDAAYDRMYPEAQIRSGELLGGNNTVPAIVLQTVDGLESGLNVTNASVQLPLLCPACGKGAHLNKRKLEKMDRALEGLVLLHITLLPALTAEGAKELPDGDITLAQAFMKYRYDLGQPSKGECRVNEHAALGLMFGHPDFTITGDVIPESQTRAMVFLTLHHRSLLAADFEPEPDLSTDDMDDPSNDEAIKAALLHMLDDQDLSATIIPSQSIFRGSYLHVLCKSGEVLPRNILQTFCAMAADCVSILSQKIHFNRPLVDIPCPTPGKPIYDLDIFLRGICLCHNAQAWKLVLDVIEQAGFGSAENAISDEFISSQLTALLLERTDEEIHFDILITRYSVVKTSADYDPFRPAYYLAAKKELSWVDHLEG